MNNIYYEPKADADIKKCLDLDKYIETIVEIENSEFTNREKNFLRLAATRLITFKYEKIADYYSQAPEEMKKFMEKLHLVIVDYDSAIANGYFKFQEDYSRLIEEIVDE